MTTSKERYRDALVIPEYRAILSSFLLTMIGQVVASFATTVLIYRRTGSPLLSALVLGLSFLPYLFGGALVSALIDRIPIRRLLITCNSLTALLVCWMALPGTPVGALLALVFAIGCLAAVFGASRSATLPDVLPGPAYIPGRSLIRMVAQGVQVGGLAAGGVLLTFMSPRGMLLTQAGAELTSALILRLGTRERRFAGSKKEGSPLEGIRDVWRVRPLRRTLTLGWLVPATALAPEALAVPYAHDRGFGSVELGLMMAVSPLSAVLAELAGVWLLPPARRISTVIPFAALVLLPLLLFVLRPGFAPTIALLLVAGIGGVHHLGLDQRLLRDAPEPIRPRAMALNQTGLMFWQGAGFAAAGALGEIAPAAGVIAVSATVGLLGVTLIKLRETG